MLEENFRRTLLLSRGSFGIFVERPISGTLLGLIALFIIWQVVAFARKARTKKRDAAVTASPLVPAALADQVSQSGSAQ